MAVYTLAMPVDLNSIQNDRHAAAYLPVLKAHPEATSRLLSILSDPRNERSLTSAEEDHDRPALVGVAKLIEADPEISLAISDELDGKRFRQAVGVALKLQMESLGWTTTGKKGVVSNSQYFGKSERYERAG